MHEDRGVVVVFSGGGTGGHLYPALALADALVGLRPDVRPFFVGARRGLEARVLPERDVEHLLLPVRGFARGRILANWRVVPALLRSLLETRRIFARLRPELVVVTGGYAGAPAGMTAILQGVPLALQEQNSVPGITTRLLARWARQIHLAFPEAAKDLPAGARASARYSGNPVRPPTDIDEGEARRRLGLESEGPVVLVVGGSQGSVALNGAVVEALEGVARGALERPPGLQLLWSTGPGHVDTVRGALDAFGGTPAWVRVVGYIDEMDRALAVTRVAVSRAGAMATSELLAWGVPMILVPLPTAAADHQGRNAEALAAAGAALCLPEDELTGTELWGRVVGLVEDPDGLQTLRRRARDRGRPEAARAIASELVDLLPSREVGS